MLAMLNNLKSLWSDYWTSYTGFSRDIWIQFGAILINSIGFMVVLYLSLYLKEAVGYSVSEIGWVILFSGFGFLIGGYIGGYLCDLVKPKLVVVVSLFLWSLSIIFVPLIINIIYLSSALFFIGFFNGLFRPASNLLILSYSDDSNKTRVLGLRRVAINLGVALAGLIGGIVVSLGYPFIFYFDSLASLIAALMIFFFCKDPKFVRTNEEETARDLTTPANIYQDFYFLSICFFVLLATMVYVQAKSTYPIYLHDHYHILVSHFAYIASINGIIIMLIEIPFLNYLRRFRQELVAGVGGFLLCIGFAILPLGLTYGFVIISCIIYTIGEIMLYPTTIVLTIDRANESNRGRYMGVYQFVFSVPELLGSIAGATLYQYDSPTILWFVCGMIGVVVYFGFWSLTFKTDHIGFSTK